MNTSIIALGWTGQAERLCRPLSCCFSPAPAPFCPQQWSAQDSSRYRYFSPLPTTHMFSVGPYALPLPGRAKCCKGNLAGFQCPHPSSHHSSHAPVPLFCSKAPIHSLISLTCTKYLTVCQALRFGQDDEQKWTDLGMFICVL